MHATTQRLALCASFESSWLFDGTNCVAAKDYSAVYYTGLKFFRITSLSGYYYMNDIHNNIIGSLYRSSNFQRNVVFYVTKPCDYSYLIFFHYSLHITERHLSGKKAHKNKRFAKKKQTSNDMVNALRIVRELRLSTNETFFLLFILLSVFFWDTTINRKILLQFFL